MVDDQAIRDLVDAFRFDEAEEAAEQADSPLREEIAGLRAEAEGQARALKHRIASLVADRRMAELAEIADATRPRSLLTLLGDSDRREAEMHLDEAVRWRAYKRKISVRHLSEARSALNKLDMELARGLVNRIDGRFLSDEQIEERDQLLLDISARSMELESIESEGRKLIEDSDDKSWWRRWLD